MSHLHTLLNKPQIYTLLLEGDDKHPYYLYIGATENMSNRWSQHVQGHEAFQDHPAGSCRSQNFRLQKPRWAPPLPPTPPYARSKCCAPYVSF